MGKRMQAAGQDARESLEINADIDSVWRAWTDPEWLRGWMVERIEGVLSAGSQIKWCWDSLGVELELDVVACDPPSRLVVRGGPPGRAPQTQSVTLTPTASGTRIDLTHAGFAGDGAGADERAGIAAGWRVMLRLLAHYLAGRAGRPRESAAVLAPLPLPLTAVGPLLHEADGRARWLCEGVSPALAAEGEAFSLRIAGGASASGRVLALAAPFQLALSWDEVDGVLMVRAIQLARGAAGGAVLAGAHACSWSPERPAWRAARGALEHAVARLVRAAGVAGGQA